MIEQLLGSDIVTQVIMWLGYIVAVLVGLKALVKSLEPIAKLTKTDKDDKALALVIKGIEKISEPINYALDYITDLKRKEGWK